MLLISTITPVPGNRIPHGWILLAIYGYSVAMALMKAAFPACLMIFGNITLLPMNGLGWQARMPRAILEVTALSKFHLQRIILLPERPPMHHGQMLSIITFGYSVALMIVVINL